MIFVKNPPPTDEILTNQLINSGYTRIKGPRTTTAYIFLCVPIAVICALLSSAIIYCFPNPIKNIIITRYIYLDFHLTDLFFALLIFAVFCIANALIKFYFIPHNIRSDKTFVGVTGNGIFVATREPIIKTRFLLLSFMPYVLLSVFLPVVLGLFNFLGYTVILMIIVNAIFSSPDIFAGCQAFFAPNDSVIVKNGFCILYQDKNTYYMTRGDLDSNGY